MSELKAYLIKRIDYVDYDEYDSAVVVAQSPDMALDILMTEHGFPHTKYDGWDHFKNIIISEVDLNTAGIVIESFNAG